MKFENSLFTICDTLNEVNMHIILYVLLLLLIYYKILKCLPITKKNIIDELIVYIKPKETRGFSQLKRSLIFESKLKFQSHLNSQCHRKSRLYSKASDDSNPKKCPKERPKKLRKRSKILEALIQENEKNKNNLCASSAFAIHSDFKDIKGTEDTEDTKDAKDCNGRNVNFQLLKSNEHISKDIKGVCFLKIKKTNNHIYATIIDEWKRSVLCISSSLDSSMSSILGTIKKKKTNRIVNNGRTIKAAWEIGKNIARKALEKGIFKVRFDRCNYRYNGRIEAFVEGAKAAGLSL